MLDGASADRHPTKKYYVRTDHSVTQTQTSMIIQSAIIRTLYSTFDNAFN